MPALQAQSPEFKPQYSLPRKKKDKERSIKIEEIRRTQETSLF
jgi:hypothetical protein